MLDYFSCNQCNHQPVRKLRCKFSESKSKYLALRVSGHDHVFQGIEGQGHRSRSRSRVRLMQSVRLPLRAVFSSIPNVFAVCIQLWKVQCIGLQVSVCLVFHLMCQPAALHQCSSLDQQQCMGSVCGLRMSQVSCASSVHLLALCDGLLSL